MNRYTIEIELSGAELLGLGKLVGMIVRTYKDGGWVVDGDPDYKEFEGRIREFLLKHKGDK